MKNPFLKSIGPVVVIALLAACGAKKRDTPPTPNPVATPQIEESKTQKNPEGPIKPGGAAPELKVDGLNKNKPHFDLESAANENFLAYTAGADDYLRGYLQQKLASVEDESVRERNKSEARKIKNVRMVIDSETGDVAVTIVRRLDGQNKSSLLGGAFDSHGIVRLSSQENHSIRGILMCLDRTDKTCYSARIRLEIGQPGSRAIVHLIYRRTSANFDYHLPTAVSNNSEFVRLVDLFYNAEDHNGRSNSLRSALIDTFEVINGRSGLRVSLTSNENELITASGPLVNASQGSVSLDRERNFDDLVDLKEGHSFKRRMHDTISNVILTGNDASREITLSFAVRPEALSGKEESLSVTFLRQHRGIITLDRMKELERFDHFERESLVPPSVQ